MNDQQEKIGNVKTDFEQKLSAINSSMKSLHSKVAEATEKVNEVKTLADENALAVGHAQSAVQDALKSADQAKVFAQESKKTADCSKQVADETKELVAKLSSRIDDVRPQQDAQAAWQTSFPCRRPDLRRRRWKQSGRAALRLGSQSDGGPLRQATWQPRHLMLGGGSVFSTRSDLRAQRLRMRAYWRLQLCTLKTFTDLCSRRSRRRKSSIAMHQGVCVSRQCSIRTRRPSRNG